jgi:dienelactone hydrolase
MLRGVVYKPEGKGPFPTVVFESGGNMAIGNLSKANASVASFYTSRGFVFFVTSRRRPEQLNPDERAGHTVQGAGKNSATLPEFEGLTKDVGAAVSWIKAQSYVDENRVAVVGYESGATAGLLTAEQDIGVRAFVIFSPSAQHWKERPEIGHALIDAVKEAKAPIFLIQAQNDYTLAPSELLGKHVVAKGRPSLCKVYPPFGTTDLQGNLFGRDGKQVWGDDVCMFLKQAMN